jgi:uncharacterized hydrophobic protein (TIGR00341 family)
LKLIEVIADAGSADTIRAIAEKHKAQNVRAGAQGDDGKLAMRLLVSEHRVQGVLDNLQNVLGAQPEARILVIPLDAVLPRIGEDPAEQSSSVAAAREALYQVVERDVRLDTNYLLLVVLSTVVAAIGLIENNVAVVIGAMVIAPLLGPNLALGLGTALGDLALMRKALKAGAAGLLLALALAIAIGLAHPQELSSPELMARTVAGWDSVMLALASGAAAALSLSTGLSSVLVGVMVAVALLPPTVTAGLMLSHGHGDLAAGAALLLAVNLVSVNLTSKLVFLWKGIRPRGWLEREKAQRATFAYIGVWLISLAALMVAIYLRQRLGY